ncbi:hypothetical protein RCH16_001671 [Cryobacterium sp. MP_M5]|uniref:hypothetical protein n=1 Tax=unclassified Cryobacterium TaxID=2649013 RepID=UPI0018C98016|nr:MULTISPECIES: hypothetical protein [unclassified Cryobacterium]MBG6058093.1 hypothetical protein [Cryobacterium sp. MP_M3]MEC5176663.1 hypothetical protein [Cryobacterium sp. MP_M5]
MKMPALAALTLLGALALTGCAAGTTSPAVGPAPTSTGSASAAPGGSCAGVNVVVDFGPLDEATITDCAATGDAATVPASQLVAAAGATTEGTAQYGDQVVCRVNGRPAADETITVDGAAPFTESCQGMPAAAAYWALWIKPSADADWEYAQEGLGSLQLKPGQSVGLVFTTGTETPTPGS